MKTITDIINFVRHEAIHKSIIRRSVMLLIFTIPGYVLNFALMITSTHFLAPDAFGIFYTAISIINLLFMPAAILVLYQSRWMSKLRATEGEAAAINAFASSFKAVVIYGGIASLFVVLVLTILGIFLKVESYLMIVLVVVASYLAYPVESLRASLQGLQRFFWLGCAGLLWMFLRFCFGLGGIALFEKPNAGVVGLILASLALCVVFLPIVKGQQKYQWSSIPLMRIDIKSVLPLIVGFLVFSAWIYADVLAAYLFLDQHSLGIYSGSSILPKAMILLSAPIAQVLYPVLAEEHTQKKTSDIKSLTKGFGMTVVVSMVFGGVAILLAPWICGGPYSIKSCVPNIMTPLMLASVPICLLRILVMYQMSLHQDKGPLTLLLPAAAYVGYLGFHASEMSDLVEFAWVFCAFSWAAFIFYGLQTLAMRVIGARTQVISSP